jgi:flavin reductase
MFRNAMARLAAGVNINTTAGGAGRGGLTATAVCSVTDDPPTVLVCINRSSRAYPLFAANRVLCVNVLREAHADLSAAFAAPSRDLDACFAKARWRTLATGCPALQDAAVTIDCKVTSVTDVGTHGVFLCEVMAVSSAAERGALIWLDRGYVRLGPDGAAA